MAGFEARPDQPQESASSGGLAAPGSVVEGMFSEQALNNTKAEVQKLVDSASSGGFAISEEGADEYIRVFRDFEKQLAAMQQTLFEASQKLQLGGSDYAGRVAAHTQSIATGERNHTRLH